MGTIWTWTGTRTRAHARMPAHDLVRTTLGRCTTTWTDPRVNDVRRADRLAGSSHSANAPERTSVSADDEDVDADEEDEEEAEGAAADLATFSLGVVLPEREEQLRQWCRAVERTAYEGLSKATRVQRFGADLAQLPRYLVLQRLHQMTVRHLLAPPSQPREEGRLWGARRSAFARSTPAHLPGVQPRDSISRETFVLLNKHTSGGLANSYQRSFFSATKLNLRKVRKLLVASVPSPELRLPMEPTTLPEGLHAQLLDLVLQPPTSAEGARGEALEIFRGATDAILALALTTGSLLSLLQLPRAVYCRAAAVRTHLPATPSPPHWYLFTVFTSALSRPPQVPVLPVALRVYHLQRRCVNQQSGAWLGYTRWLQQAGIAQFQAPPGDADTMATPDAATAVLVGAATGASVVWDTLAAREGLQPLPGAETGRIGLRTLPSVVRRIIELSANGTTKKDIFMSPQQVTEMWQPLAVELRGETLLTLASLLVALLSGERGSREMVAAIAALRLLTVHLILFKRCNIDAATVLLPPPSAAGDAEPAAGGLRAHLLERMFSVLLVPVNSGGVSEQLRDIWVREAAESPPTILLSSFSPAAGPTSRFPRPS